MCLFCAKVIIFSLQISCQRKNQTGHYKENTTICATTYMAYQGLQYTICQTHQEGPFKKVMYLSTICATVEVANNKCF